MKVLKNLEVCWNLAKSVVEKSEKPQGLSQTCGYLKTAIFVGKQRSTMGVWSTVPYFDYSELDK